MRSRPKKNGVDKFVRAALLCVLAFSGPSLALTESRPESELRGKLAQATQTPATAQAQPSWGVSCAGTPGGLDCRALQVVRMTNTGQLSVAVHVPAETKKPIMLLLLPLGIDLRAGVTLQLGQDEKRAVPLNNCDASGCLAEYAISEAEIGAMAKGQAVTVSVKGPNDQPISVQVPSTGFAAAYAKIK